MEDHSYVTKFLMTHTTTVNNTCIFDDRRWSVRLNFISWYGYFTYFPFHSGRGVMIPVELYAYVDCMYHTVYIWTSVKGDSLGMYMIWHSSYHNYNTILNQLYECVVQRPWKLSLNYTNGCSLELNYYWNNSSILTNCSKCTHLKMQCHRQSLDSYQISLVLSQYMKS